MALFSGKLPIASLRHSETPKFVNLESRHDQSSSDIQTDQAGSSISVDQNETEMNLVS
jgi:hypothetical protein